MSDADPNPASEAAAAPLGELDSQRAMMARLRGEAAVGWPVDVTAAPLILDTDIGSDADDALTLAAAAFEVPELELVCTGDETGPRAGGYGQRARAARWLLDECGRADVPVAAGAALGDIDYFVLAGAIPDGVPAAGGDVVEAVSALAARTEGPLRWVGLAPMSNLARVITEAPQVAARLHVTQMGAAIHYRNPDRAEHNVRLDVDAARVVLDAAQTGRLAGLELVISDVTFTEQIAIGADHPLARQLDDDPAGWAQMLAVSLQRWFDHPRGFDHSMQHDALTLSAALELPFVESFPAHVVFDSIGRLGEADPSRNGGAGGAVWVSRRADYPAFMGWLESALTRGHVAGAAAGLAGARVAGA